MTQETFAKASIVKTRLEECRKLKETISNPHIGIADTSTALAHFFRSYPDEVNRFLEDKIEELQAEFNGICECEHCKYFQPKPEEPVKPTEPEEPTEPTEPTEPSSPDTPEIPEPTGPDKVDEGNETAGETGQQD